MTTAITVLNKANVPTGPFTREQVTEKLKSGEFSLNDLAFVEGLSQWTLLGEVMAKIGGVTSLPPPPAFTPPSAPPAGVPAYSYAATMQPPSHLVYAGFWLRFAAYFIDGLILSVPLFIFVVILCVVVGVFAAVTGVATHSTGSGDAHQTFGLVMGLGAAVLELAASFVSIVIVWLYFAKLESGQEQATYGKRMMGIYVTDLSGKRIGFGQASGRFFGKIVSSMTFYVGFIMAGFTERKQALHDMIAGTLVVKK